MNRNRVFTYLTARSLLNLRELCNNFVRSIFHPILLSQTES